MIPGISLWSIKVWPSCTTVTIRPSKVISKVRHFPGLRGSSGGGVKESVNPARVVAGGFLNGVGFYLHLIAAPQIHATVGLGTAVKFQMQFEILELGGGDNFSAVSVVDQFTVFDLPVARVARITKPPATEILAVKQRDRLAPDRCTGPLQAGRFLPIHGQEVPPEPVAVPASCPPTSFPLKVVSSLKPSSPFGDTNSISPAVTWTFASGVA